MTEGPALTTTCNNAILEWPLAVIDFEASALSIESYPIEVGIAIMANATADIEIWSTLIKPAPHWNMRAQWDPDAERIHVRCAQATSAGIVFFAVATANSAHAARILSSLLLAHTAGKTIVVEFDPNDTTGTAFGCSAHDCRRLLSVAVQ